MEGAQINVVNINNSRAINVTLILSSSIKCSVDVDVFFTHDPETSVVEDVLEEDALLDPPVSRRLLRVVRVEHQAYGNPVAKLSTCPRHFYPHGVFVVQRRQSVIQSGFQTKPRLHLALSVT